MTKLEHDAEALFLEILKRYGYNMESELQSSIMNWIKERIKQQAELDKWADSEEQKLALKGGN